MCIAVASIPSPIELTFRMHKVTGQNEEKWHVKGKQIDTIICAVLWGIKRLASIALWPRITANIAMPLAMSKNLMRFMNLFSLPFHRFSPPLAGFTSPAIVPRIGAARLALYDLDECRLYTMHVEAFPLSVLPCGMPHMPKRTTNHAAGRGIATRYFLVP